MKDDEGCQYDFARLCLVSSIATSYRHAHVLVDLFGSARTRAPQHSPPPDPPDPPDPAARRSPVADSAMPSYEDALTAFSEARSLLARAEDAMQHAVQMEQQKNVDLRPTQN